MAKKISIVIPSYNEEKNIGPVFNEIKKNLPAKGYEFEIIFVNDGSSDTTWEVIKKLALEEKIVKGINFSRNFGHPSALQAGLEMAGGDAVIMMDGDLQHPPAYIPKLISAWESGAEVVNTVRESTEKIGIFKKVTSALYYRLLNMFSDLSLNEGEADFRLLDRKVLNVLNDLPESPKFYRGLVNWVGFNVTKINYKAEARVNGRSSFTLKKMIELARMGLTSFSMKPLKIIITIGIGLSSVSLAALLFMMYLKLFIDYNYISNNIILLTFLIFITGLLSTFQGIIAIYLVDIFNAAKGRPAYIIKERINDKK